jgi:hypothetical protein
MNTAVAAGLKPHGNDRVATMLLEPARFRDCRRRGDDLGAGRLHAIEQRPLGKPEKKADDLGAAVLHKPAEIGVERHASAGRDGRFRIKPLFQVVRREPREPRPRPRRVGWRRNMTEEVEVDRL